MQNPFVKIHWIYINLEHRKDRNEQVRKELLEFIPEENIHRIDAIKHEKGFLGCTLSHIKALEFAKQFEISCILEDDFMWIQKERVWNILNQLFVTDYDVFLGSGSGRIFEKGTGTFNKVINSQTTSCYIPNKNYIDTLIQNFKESIEQGIALDIYWRKLQKKDKFIGLKINISSQRSGYSDIEKSNQDYTKTLSTLILK